MVKLASHDQNARGLDVLESSWMPTRRTKGGREGHRRGAGEGHPAALLQASPWGRASGGARVFVQS